MNKNKTRHSLIFGALLIAAIVLGACSGIPVIGGQPGSIGTPTADSDNIIRSLASVEDLEVRILESFPVQVEVVVRGSLPDSCTTIEGIVKNREGNTFTIGLGTARPSESVCVQTIRPYEEAIALDVEGLPAGAYTVNVNGVSETFDLLVDNNPSTGTSEIRGKVWHDLCALAGLDSSGPITPGVGCVRSNTTDSGYLANGLFEIGEPGIAGMEVTLGLGVCPSTGLATEITDGEGSFAFGGLSAGTYCISVDPLREPNKTILGAGYWSAPSEAVNRNTASYTVTLGEGEARTELNFGWDYHFLPEPEATPTPTMTPTQPPPTPTPTPTNVPLPCDLAQFVADVSVPDGTPFTPGSSFTKTWRLKNTGTCTWTDEYSLSFVSGNAMSDKVNFDLPKTVRPGETVDLSVKMTAPKGNGNYKGNWMLRNEDGDLFGIGSQGDLPFWASIKVISADPNSVFDFAANYCLADWESDDGELACPGNPESDRGSVLLLDNPRLENRPENEPTLWTRPNAEKGGWIDGTYPELKVKSGYHFKAWVGCLDETKGCDLTFRLRYRDEDGDVRKLGEWREVYDGQVTVIDLDLSNLAGETVEFILSTEANTKKTDVADGFWFIPRISQGSSSSDSAAAVAAARNMVAAQIGASAGDVSLKRVEGPIEWADSCLGVQVEGQVCAPAVVPGFRIILELDDKEYEAHTNMDGSVVWWFWTS